MKPKLRPPGTKRLKLEYDGLRSNFGFRFDLRRYIKDNKLNLDEYAGLLNGRGLRSSTFQLNLSRF